jgi:hypothetical protein
MEYVVSLLLFIALIVAFIQVSFVENFETPAQMRSKCPEGCHGSSSTTPDGKTTQYCSKNDSVGNVTQCPVLDKCLPGDVEKDGMCMFCQPPFKLVGDKCTTGDPTDYPAKIVGRAPCASGQIESNSMCFEPCTNGKKLNGFLCMSSNAQTTPPAPVLSPVGAPSCKIENFADF